MDTPSGLSKSLRTALIACIALLLIVGPVAGQTGVLIDGFEDGDLSEWNGVDQYFSITSNSADVYDGQYAAQVGDGSNQAGAYSISYISDSYTTASNYVKIEQMDDYTEWWFGKDTVGVIWIRVDGNGNVQAVDSNGDNVDTGIDISTGTYYRFEYSNIDYANSQYDVEVINAEAGTSVGTATVSMGENGVSSLDTYDVQSGYNNPIFYLDEIRVGNRLVDVYNVEGTVTGENTNDPIADATVEIANESGLVTFSGQTDGTGYYNADLTAGNYTFDVSKQGYRGVTRDVEVTQNSGRIQDFQLASLNESIELQLKNYLEHGGESDYTVILENETGRHNVSTEATVTSQNESIVTVNQQGLNILATRDTAVNDRTTVTAEITQNGNTYVDTQNVTVANATVENIKLLPTWTKTSASIGDKTLQVIIVATIIASAVAIVAGSFAGIAAHTLIMTAGWLAGYAGNGMVIVSFLFAIFVGLNVATNFQPIMNPRG